MSAPGENASHRVLQYSADSDVRVELSWHGLTHVGLRRETNQDSYLAIPPVFAVADGMGGHEGGEIASAAVTMRLAELAESGDAVDIDSLVRALTVAVTDIQSEDNATRHTAGTTVTGAFFGTETNVPNWNIFNIGDSRVYHFFEGALTQVTRDHSVVQHLLDSGAITPAEAEVHPHANIITRAVGGYESPVPDLMKIAIVPGQRILICSDGLTKELTDVGIQYFLSQADTAADAAEVLLEHALGNTGRDNISVIVLEVHALTGVPAEAEGNSAETERNLS
ncbi:serine/threonine-protein phosphatase [Canibacter sp. lx-72]|uniref:PP2C family protein-serine/threonine phosphatase n=1 Tax=Canibacter zhuwentaonis TaxID=2837491 RepID=UPI001BDBF001|nr:protein phosphatase 2C domain-containing protein [Canibacter zhuwentaonis]MBT1017647.1 serine/threonine-protein phosphatase [Canibacter zhuwentaonis]MBT1034802.1 serine/threonine-protein phosphatase [Canibacter zhuwentaonis]